MRFKVRCTVGKDEVGTMTVRDQELQMVASHLAFLAIQGFRQQDGTLADVEPIAITIEPVGNGD